MSKDSLRGRWRIRGCGIFQFNSRKVLNFWKNLNDFHHSQKSACWLFHIDDSTLLINPVLRRNFCYKQISLTNISMLCFTVYLAKMLIQSVNGLESVAFSWKAGWVNISMKMTSDKQHVYSFLATVVSREKHGMLAIGYSIECLWENWCFLMMARKDALS